MTLWLAGQLDATVIAASAVGLCALFRRRLPPGVRSGLLAIALARLVAPPGVVSVWSLGAGAWTPLERARPLLEGWLTGPWGAAGAALVALVAAVRLSVLAWRAVRGEQGREGVWAPAPERWRAYVASLAGAESLRRPIALEVSARGCGPLVTGLHRPRIVVPPHLFTLDDSAVAAVLAHETAHVVRRDLLWIAAASVAQTVVWFNPVAHLAAAALIAAREDAADDWSIVASGSAPITYCQAILRSARVAGPSSRPFACAAHPLGRRFQRLLDPAANRRARLGWSGGLALGLGLLAALAGGAPLSERPELPDLSTDDRIVRVVVRAR